MAGFEDLEVWQRAVSLSVDVYRRMASCKDFGFRDQITRSARCGDPGSDQGAARKTAVAACKVRRAPRANQFRTQVIVGSRAGLLECELAEEWIAASRTISAMVQGLIRSLKQTTDDR
jgi:four helix bundle protein